MAAPKKNQSETTTDETKVVEPTPSIDAEQEAQNAPFIFGLPPGAYGFCDAETGFSLYYGIPGQDEKTHFGPLTPSLLHGWATGAIVEKSGKNLADYKDVLKDVKEQVQKNYEGQYDSRIRERVNMLTVSVGNSLEHQEYFTESEINSLSLTALIGWITRKSLFDELDVRMSDSDRVIRAALLKHFGYKN